MKSCWDCLFSSIKENHLLAEETLTRVCVAKDWALVDKCWTTDLHTQNHKYSKLLLRDVYYKTVENIRVQAFSIFLQLIQDISFFSKASNFEQYQQTMRTLGGIKPC